VTLAERRAEKSRDAADDATDERREKERAAIRAAQQARNAEQKLADARETLSVVQGLQNVLADDQARLGTLKDGPEKEQLKSRIAHNEANLARFGGKEAVEALAENVTSMEQSVASLRQTEIANQEASDKSDAKESRARAKQYRDEVTAAKADPDTYVAGDIHSVDPVTQVSISVIGEGLIQLRGPIKGINKIRTMINQIDSPVGQIKIGIFSVQVNGEKGDKMEKVIGDAESNIDLSRFLVNHSLELLRKAIQAEAAMIASQCDIPGHYQVDRDRRYLYSFFGRDFIDELYAMNSEFLNTENKLLSLHAMDTVSLNRALFILALAKNDVRERIVTQFLASAQTELADAEYDFRRSSELQPHRTQKKFPPWNLTRLPVWNRTNQEEIVYEAVHRNAMQRYHFRNLSGFFDVGFTNPDTMNPMQREFIKLAQIFKARLVAEMEWKQRVMERGLMEDRSNDETKRAEIIRSVHDEALTELKAGYLSLLASIRNLRELGSALALINNTIGRIPSKGKQTALAGQLSTAMDEGNLKDALAVMRRQRQLIAEVSDAKNQWTTNEDKKVLQDWLPKLDTNIGKASEKSDVNLVNSGDFDEAWGQLIDIVGPYRDPYQKLETAFGSFRRVVESQDTSSDTLGRFYREVTKALEQIGDTPVKQNLGDLAAAVYQDKANTIGVQGTIAYVEEFLNQTRGQLDHRKLLNHLIDEQEDKFIELVEGTRSHIAVMDHYLKRLSIALEDDFKVQFYDPAFVRVREAARSKEVNLGQVERTTILTNNRAFAKVDPQATMEFDLPKRQIAIKEAFDAAKALVEDTGALVNDPTFLAAFQMMGGSKQPTTVKNLVPGQSTSTDQQSMGMVPQRHEGGAPGSALQNLVPEPAIYKLETGTGFQIRPVMQPDGDSVVYDFDYMYTTNIREPVRADEKHLGRIKRHFVHKHPLTSFRIG